MSDRFGGRGRGGGRGGGGRGGPGGRGGQPSPQAGRGDGGRGGGGRRGRGQGQGRGRGPELPSAALPSHPSSSSSSLPASASSPSGMMEEERFAAAPESSVSAVARDLEERLSVHGGGGQEVQKNVVPPASSKAIRFPARPGFGTIGLKVVVKANHFLVQVADRDLHHYDVSISPEVRSKKVCRDIMTQLENDHRHTYLGDRMLAYDGSKSTYTAGSLPFASKEFVVKLVNRDETKAERQFKVSIKFAAKVDLHRLEQYLHGRQLDVPQETIQALDVVLREKPSNIYEVVGRSFFHPSLGGKGALGDGIEYWMGFYQSIRPTQMGLSLNIDVSARAFYESNQVADFVAFYLNKDLSRPLSDQDRVKLKKVLKNVRVAVLYQKHARRYKISGVSSLPLRQLSFTQDGKNISIVEYFFQRYNVVLRHTALPALQAGDDKNPAYLPMEVCKIVEGQRYAKKLNDKQVSALLKATCQRPSHREESIRRMVANNIRSGDGLVRQEFGIEILPELTSIDARVLPPPKLKYHEDGREPLVDPRVGQWNMINKKMVNGGRVDNWTCVNFSRDCDPAKFCNMLIDMCSKLGMVFGPRPLIPIESGNPRRIERTLGDIHTKCSTRLQNLNSPCNYLQLLFVILPDVTGYYGTIKRVCETQLGIVSQCCRPKQASRCNVQYLENVALKINVKAGGRNSVLQQAVQRNIPFLTDRVTIIFGADVTHPQPGEDSTPSIAAVVASMDWPEATKYRGLVSAQQHRQEIIQDLYTTKDGTEHGGMIRELLIAFRRSTRLRPERIIFYRDGVSEGQFNQVLWHEMDAIRKACVSLEANYLPRVTFVVVQKRHHTRLFPANHGNRNLTDRSGNILPGTVVDTKICHPTEFDFYLCSHAGIQGTSRPAHYHVLYDENGFSADAMQILTNNLCYTYARCTRSVSIVPPAYYAHLAAFRARYYIEGEYTEDGSASGSSRPTREQNVQIKQLPGIKDNVKEVMFYC